MADVIIVGGGVIGLSIAYELAGQGLDVKLLEQGQFGQEASWAGAGILPPGEPAGARTPEAQLRARSHILWPHWTAQLKDETGIDNGYTICGGLEIRLSGPPGELQAEARLWRNEGVATEELTPEEALRCEPELNPNLVAAYRLPEMGQVRNPRHLKALVAGCAARGVELLSGTGVVHFEISHDRVVALRTTSGTDAADQIVVAGGAWTGELLWRAGVNIPVEPVRGQIVLLSAQPVPVTNVIGVGRQYVVARPDGRILVGSTEEQAGFNKRTTAGGVRTLLSFAADVIPALAAARFERCWAGLRPGSADGLPYIGRLPAVENLVVAAGHFRSGLQMSPGTAVLVRQLIMKQPADISLAPFAPQRRLSVTARKEMSTRSQNHS